MDTPNTNFSALLKDAITQPGSIMSAYSAFHDFSLGNQLLALFQCQLRGLELGPLNTFPRWEELGRHVKKGEKALTLCMPITVKRSRSDDESNDASEGKATIFVHKRRWFVISQTEGQELELPAMPTWNAQQALLALDITQVSFTSPDGNCQGYATCKREIAINPVAQLPHKTFFHECAHVLLHSSEGDFTDTHQTPKNLREIEAEAVALLCCEALGLEGSAFCRGYIQGWANGEPIPEQSARKILGASDRILKAGTITKQPTIH